MVYANGFPKSGNHALVKTLELLGQPAEVHHTRCSEAVEGAHVFIKRDPRNVVVSWLRHHRHAVTPGTFLTAFRKFEHRPLVDEMGEFEGWLTTAYVVRFEDLIADEATMRGIAAFVGAPYIDGAFAALPGDTLTYNDVPSDYRAVWTPLVAETFSREGGDALLTRWGY